MREFFGDDGAHAAYLEKASKLAKDYPDFAELVELKVQLAEYILDKFVR